VDWCTKIPLDTPLERLVTADPAIEVIERDFCASAYLELAESQERWGLPVRESEDFTEAFAAIEREAPVVMSRW